MKTTFLRSILTTIFLIASVTTWAYDVEVNGIYYNLDQTADTASVTYKGSDYYSGNSYSGSVTIPETIVSDGVTYSVTNIGDYAFFHCSGLTSVSIGNSVKSIGKHAFEYSSGLTSITIGNSVTSIGWYAFHNCTGLKEIHSNPATPPSTASDTFSGVKTANCKLYVPTGTKDDYAFADGWSDFVNIIEEEVVDPSGEIEKPEVVVENGKLKFTCATEGVTYLYSIKALDATATLQESTDGTVALQETYKITVYAKKDGKTSEAATATIKVGHTADVNGDSVIDISDVNAVLKKMLE